jgi:hypothetical protein
VIRTRAVRQGPPKSENSHVGPWHDAPGDKSAVPNILTARTSLPAGRVVGFPCSTIERGGNATSCRDCLAVFGNRDGGNAPYDGHLREATKETTSRAADSLVPATTSDALNVDASHEDRESRLGARPMPSPLRATRARSSVDTDRHHAHDRNARVMGNACRERHTGARCTPQARLCRPTNTQS